MGETNGSSSQEFREVKVIYGRGAAMGLKRTSR
jgi:hypothetical protein